MRAVSGFGIGMLGCGAEIIGFTAVVAVGTMGIVARGKDVRCKRLCVLKAQWCGTLQPGDILRSVFTAFLDELSPSSACFGNTSVK